MILHRFGNGDIVEQGDKALIARFNGRRRVLSTSALNGGIRDDLTAVFNQDCKEDGENNDALRAPSYEEHLKFVAAGLGLEPLKSAGLTTAADMRNAAVSSVTYDTLTVTAVVTGGIDVNGGRVGDPADWHEADGVCVPAGGTINILLFIGACLPAGTIARALVTCTEAKTAALQELLAPSVYGCGVATGSGTDGTAIVSDLESPLVLTWAGKHSKLGELIGRAVMTAVKEALYRQTGLGPEQQSNIFARIGRYGITREIVLREKLLADVILGVQEGSGAANLDALSKNPELTVLTSLYVHLLDQLTWGLISPEDAVPAANRLLRDMGMALEILPHLHAESAITSMLAAYKQGLLKRLEL
jgi:adenosylcobinamide amidohydrolase